MRYANLLIDDFVNGEGVSVSLFTQGCPFHCEGCFNEETWDFQGGKEIDIDVLICNIIDVIAKNDIKRNFSILGGEPLAPSNINDVATIIAAVRVAYPDIKIMLWTGYEEDELPQSAPAQSIYKDINKIIVGRFDLSKRDITLPLRGSSNQKVIELNA